MIDTAALRNALVQGEFYLEYLPTIALADGRCIGGEELIRWRRPTRIVPPSEFIPLVENTPLSGLLTYWVIETVAAELGDWLRPIPTFTSASTRRPRFLAAAEWSTPPASRDWPTCSPS
jgi:sensor c-di-GMP phosphodiesterase-like protein